MPAFPWAPRQAVEPDREYAAMASRLPLQRYRSVPGFLRDTMAIRRQLAQAPGLVGYALDAELGRKTFWTFSVWQDRASLQSFAAADPHRLIIQRLRPLMGHTQFAFFPVTGAELPMNWEKMKAPVRESPAGGHGR
jgi:hypothetical protein